MSIRSFDFPEGQLLAERYEIVRRLGEGWESEVYLVKERATSIERAAKVFLPARNPGNRVARKTAKKLHELRHCGALIQYITHEAFEVDEQPVTMLISEFVDGCTRWPLRLNPCISIANITAICTPATSSCAALASALKSN